MSQLTHPGINAPKEVWGEYVAAGLVTIVLSVPEGFALGYVAERSGYFIAAIAGGAALAGAYFVLPARWAARDPKNAAKRAAVGRMFYATWACAALALLVLLATIQAGQMWTSSSSLWWSPGVVGLALVLFTAGWAGPVTVHPEGIAPPHLGGLRGGEIFVRGAEVKAAADPDSPAAPAVDPTALMVGTEKLRHESEPEHIFICGATGSGKSQIINGFARAIRARGAAARAVILDPGGAYFAQFGRPGQDVLLNPFDKRGVGWNLFAEVQGAEDFRRCAEAIIPSRPGPGQEWTEFAQQIFADAMKAMWRQNENSMARLHELLTGSSETLFEYLRASGITSLADPHAMKMFSGAKNSMGPFIQCLEYIQPGDFSIRRWIRENEGKDGWLFITYRDNQMALIRNFISGAANFAMLETLSLEPDTSRRVFFIIDELDSVGKIEMLKDSQVKARKFGGSICIGIQTVAQLRPLYGDLNSTIIGNSATRIVLRPQDAETAEYMSRMLGKVEVRRRNFHESYGQTRQQNGSSSSSSASTSWSNETRDAFLPADLQNLQNLEGILQRAAAPLVVFKQRYVEPQKNEPAFVPRDDLRI